MKRMLYLAPVALLAGCQTVVATQPANCSEFIPTGWKAPVDGYPLPADDTLPAWQAFGVGQSGQLSKANDRQADTLHIFETCEKRTNDALPRRKFLGVF